MWQQWRTIILLILLSLFVTVFPSLPTPKDFKSECWEFESLRSHQQYQQFTIFILSIPIVGDLLETKDHPQNQWLPHFWQPEYNGQVPAIALVPFRTSWYLWETPLDTLSPNAFFVKHHKLLFHKLFFNYFLFYMFRTTKNKTMFYY